MSLLGDIFSGNATFSGSLDRLASTFDPSTAQGSALAKLGQQLNSARDNSHMEKVFAANPNYALKLYGAKNQQDDNEINRQISLARLQSLAAGGDKPSALQELAALDQMTPEQKRNYWNIKRNQWQNAGGMLINPETGEQIQKTVSPDQQPALKGAQAAAINEADLIGKPKIAAQTLKETAATEKEIAFPAASARVDNNIKIIDDALSHPGFDANFGKMGVLPSIPGGEAADAGTYIDQIKGTAFLTAIDELKGTGQITEKEGEAATAAVARLQKAQSAPSARKALTELKDILLSAKNRAAAGTKFEGTESLSSGIPAGAVLIGSQGGKPVYKLPDGRGWIP